MRFARAHWSKVAILAIPLLIALTNQAWLTNKVADVDLWFYNGYFKVLRMFAANRELWGPEKYFETRLPIIVPGAVVYGLFPDAVAKVVLNLCILHGIIALSFWYVVRTHISAIAATAATVLLVTDIFYLRTIGWDYVDNAVLAYQALTFALLTSLKGRADPRLRIAGAGFAAMSMLAVNFGSAVMMPIFAVYALFVVEPLASVRALPKRVARLIGWGALGAAVCLLLYGAISKLVLHGPFAFWLEQLRGGQQVKPARYAASLVVLALKGNYLALHAAVLMSAFVALVVQRFRREPTLTPFAWFCLVTTAVVYPLLLVGEGFKVTWFLARSGLYASNLLVVSYLTVAVLVFGSPRVTWRIVLFVLLLFPSVAIAKLAIHDGAVFSLKHPQPMLAVAAPMAVAMAVAFAFERRGALVAAVAALGALSLFVPWRFQREDSIVEARNYILTGGGPPRVFYSEGDPQRAVFVSIAAALTDHVLHDHYGGFPRPLARGDRIAVLDTRFASDSANGGPCTIRGLRADGARQFSRRYVDVVVHLFEVTDDVRKEDVHCRLLSVPDPRSTPFLRFDAAALPSHTGELRADARVAKEGTSSAGSLTLGPTIHLDAGAYEVTFHYSSIRPEHQWEIEGVDGSETRSISAGELPSTEGKPSSLSAPFRLPAPIEALALKTYFAGVGELAVTSITVDRLPIE